MKPVEYCTNTEWLFTYGPLSDVPTDYREELASDFLNELCDAVEANPALADIALRHARGQRMTCNGWHGARFPVRVSCFGTFAELTEQEQDLLRDAIETVLNKVQKAA